MDQDAIWPSRTRGGGVPDSTGALQGPSSTDTVLWVEGVGVREDWEERSEFRQTGVMRCPAADQMLGVGDGDVWSRSTVSRPPATVREREEMNVA